MTRARVALGGLAAMLFVLTLLTAWTRWSALEVPGDYRPFELAATRFWAGDPLYQTGDDPFLSPPPFVYFLLPAHALGPVGGHALALFAGLACSGLAIWLTRRAIQPSPSIDAALGCALYLPIWLSAGIGQWGGFFFLVLALVMTLARAGRALEAGLCAALLCAKPTYAPFAVAVVALGLGRRAWIGLGIGAIAWVLASLPLGLASWSAWRTELRWTDEVHAFAGHGWQQHTLFGTLHALFGDGVRPVWLALAAPLGLVTIAVAVRALRRGDAAQAFALVALGTAALNVYLRYYDSQIVLIAVLALLARPERSPVTGALALLYLLLASVDAAYFQEQIPVPVEGVILTVWLALELRQAWGAPAPASPAPAT